MPMKASKFKELLGDVPNAAAIVAEGIRKGEIEDDGTGEPVFKSETYEALVKSLLASVDKLKTLPETAPERTNDKATALKKSAAAENAPEMVSAVINLEDVVKAVEKSQVEGTAALAKSLIQVAEANAASIRGFVDLATQLQTVAAKVNEMHIAKSAAVEPVGEVGTSTPVPSPMDKNAAAASSGASDFAAYQAEFDNVDRLIKGALSATPHTDSKRRAALSQATLALMGGTKKPAELIAELGLK
jgi:hypothetical protein